MSDEPTPQPVFIHAAQVARYCDDCKREVHKGDTIVVHGVNGCAYERHTQCYNCYRTGGDK